MRVCTKYSEKVWIHLKQNKPLKDIAVMQKSVINMSPMVIASRKHFA